MRRKGCTSVRRVSTPHCRLSKSRSPTLKGQWFQTPISFDRRTLAWYMAPHLNPIYLVNRNHSRPANIRGEQTHSQSRSSRMLQWLNVQWVLPCQASNARYQGDPEEACHFIGYVLFRGKVWEFDGSKSGSAEAVELHTSPLPLGSDTIVHQDWTGIVQPRTKMHKYGEGRERGWGYQVQLAHNHQGPVLQAL
jgi:hypothetical protein